MSGSKKKKSYDPKFKMNLLPAGDEDKRKNNKKPVPNLQMKQAEMDEAGNQEDENPPQKTEPQKGEVIGQPIPYQDMSWGSAVELEENLQKKAPPQRPQPVKLLSGREYYAQLPATCPSYYRKCQKSTGRDPAHLCQTEKPASQPSCNFYGSKPTYPTQSGVRPNAQQQQSNQAHGGRYPAQQQQYGGKSTAPQQSGHAYGGRPTTPQQYGGRPNSQSQASGQPYGGRSSGQHQQPGHAYGGRPQPPRTSGQSGASQPGGSRPPSQQHIGAGGRSVVQEQPNQSLGGRPAVPPQVNQASGGRTSLQESVPPTTQNVGKD